MYVWVASLGSLSHHPITHSQKNQQKENLISSRATTDITLNFFFKSNIYIHFHYNKTLTVNNSYFYVTFPLEARVSERRRSFVVGCDTRHNCVCFAGVRRGGGFRAKRGSTSTYIHYEVEKGKKKNPSGGRSWHKGRQLGSKSEE